MSVRDEIRALADDYARQMKEKIDERVGDMDADDKSHFLIYQVLGISDEEGHLIDVYQNRVGSYTDTRAAFWRTQRSSASGPRFPTLEHFASRTRKAVGPRPLKSIAWLEAMRWRSSGAMRPLMATISLKNTRGFRRSVLPATRPFASCSTTRTEIKQ